MIALVWLACAHREPVERLPVRPPITSPPYTRAAFGAPWSDVDHNGCDTRDDVLRRDLADVVLADDGCRVLSGTLTCPYTGHVIAYVRGDRSVDVDHVVPLADAWRTGAAGWTDAARVQFANDPENLLAVDAATNRRKGDADAAAWLPPHGVCAYAARQVEVKRRYELWVTPREHAALTEVLATCGQATGGSWPTPPSP